MPRYLYLLRHAQSADKQTGQTDKERALTSAGWQHAKAVGFFLKEKSLIPQLIIASSALRAKTTAQAVAEVLNYNSQKILVADELYEARVSAFFEILSRVETPIESVLIVGHNPVITYFAEQLTNEQHGFLTSEVLGLKIDSDNWSELQKRKVEIIARFHPNL